MIQKYIERNKQKRIDEKIYILLCLYNSIVVIPNNITYEFSEFCKIIN